MTARALQTHNHASKAAAIAETMRAGHVPVFDRDYILSALPGSRERFAIARYQHAGAPRWCIVPERVLRECLAEAAAAEAAGRARLADAYRHALGEPEPAPDCAGLEVIEHATPGQEAAADCPVDLLRVAGA